MSRGVNASNGWSGFIQTKDYISPQKVVACGFLDMQLRFTRTLLVDSIKNGFVQSNNSPNPHEQNAVSRPPSPDRSFQLSQTFWPPQMPPPMHARQTQIRPLNFPFRRFASASEQ